MELQPCHTCCKIEDIIGQQYLASGRCSSGQVWCDRHKFKVVVHCRWYSWHCQEWTLRKSRARSRSSAMRCRGTRWPARHSHTLALSRLLAGWGSERRNAICLPIHLILVLQIAHLLLWVCCQFCWLQFNADLACLCLKPRCWEKEREDSRV